jgi:hypothetical protein
MRGKHGLNILLKGCRIGSSLDNHGLPQPKEAIKVVFPASIARYRACGSLPFECPAVAWGQSNIGATFVNLRRVDGHLAGRLEPAKQLAPAVFAKSLPTSFFRV